MTSRLSAIRIAQVVTSCQVAELCTPDKRCYKRGAVVDSAPKLRLARPSGAAAVLGLQQACQALNVHILL